MKDFAFDLPVILQLPTMAPIRTAEEAVCVLRAHLRSRFSIAGLNTLLMLERAIEWSECEEARIAFCSWASNEQLLATHIGS